MMGTIIAIDSYKGCLSSREANEAAMAAFPEGEAAIVPVSDGGEGFSTIVTDAIGGHFREVRCSDPLGRPVIARYGLSRDERIAVIETAAASGLGLVEPEERNLLVESSFGTGELMSDALDMGVEEIWLGLGGTATCDGGTGMAQALGYRFLTAEGALAPGMATMGNIVAIDSSHKHKKLKDCKIIGYYDVSVPFHGPSGAARMFAPQKGAGPELTEAIDEWMTRLCQVYSMFSGEEIKNVPGSGAAGGIGGALRTLFRSEMIPGIWKVLDLSGFGDLLDESELVITGEGHSDSQTLKGKVPMGVLSYVRRYDFESGVPGRTKVFLLSGQVSDKEELLAAGFDGLENATPEGTPLQEAMKSEAAKRNILSAARRIANK